ncbi:MAG: archaeosortase/exosortase family protein, partial [Planctomycetales bacterium]|nr:archaeosortase/exosortase family protein [Planctomycetales bacterium]
MSTSVATPPTRAGRLRHSIDWLLGLSLLSSLPLASVFFCDLWFRSDYRFFPLLMIVPLVMPVWRGRKQPQAGSGSRQSVKDIPRGPISLGLWFASGLSAICAPLLFSPWLAMLALTLSWCAWILVRMGQTPWPQLLKWTLPLLVLLLLPLSERSDPLPSFSSSVTYASSSLLDLLGIANAPAEQRLQLQNGSYDVAAACRGLGNPYLLFSAAILLCMSTRCSLSLGLLTVGSAPLWSWGGSVLLATASAWLVEKQGMFVWLEERLWIAQAM